MLSCLFFVVVSFFSLLFLFFPQKVVRDDLKCFELCPFSFHFFEKNCWCKTSHHQMKSRKSWHWIITAEKHSGKKYTTSEWEGCGKRIHISKMVTLLFFCCSFRFLTQSYPSEDPNHRQSHIADRLEHWASAGAVWADRSICSSRCASGKSCYLPLE